MKVRAEILVRGFVQGVGYRRFAQKRAFELDLCGYVRNEDDGAVRVEVEGERTAVETYVERLRAGPSFSRVTELELRWMDYSGRYTQFDITF